MPELPEVQTVVNTLQSRLVKRRLRDVRLVRGDILTPQGFPLAEALAGRTVMQITRRGKRIVFQLDRGERFYIHLGMTGRLTIEPADTPIVIHTHFIARLDSAQANGLRPEELRFRDPRRFGGIWWLGDRGDPAEGMGPEPLELRPARLVRLLRPAHRPIKAALLDQTLIAGIGNIYADEALFAAGIHPLRLCDSLSDEEVYRLNRGIKRVLRRAIHHRGSTLRDYVDADGTPGMAQHVHRIYDRAGDPCLGCGREIVRIIVGGRSTHFCPACQPPRPRRNAP